MINPLWIWRALKDHSVTFSALCSMTLLGASAFPLLRSGATWLGASGLLVWLFPIALSAVIASKEEEWIPSRDTRRILAWGLFGACLAIALLLRLLAGPATPPPVT